MSGDIPDCGRRCRRASCTHDLLASAGMTNAASIVAPGSTAGTGPGAVPPADRPKGRRGWRGWLAAVLAVAAPAIMMAARVQGASTGGGGEAETGDGQLLYT